MRKLVFYRALNGHSYFREWLDRLDIAVRSIIERRLDRIMLGNFGDSKPVGDGVQELRFHFGQGWRVYYGIDGSEIILLLTGSDKRGQDNAIVLAKTLWKEYKLHKHAN
jgi:putative addiction module killer protein